MDYNISQSVFTHKKLYIISACLVLVGFIMILNLDQGNFIEDKDAPYTDDMRGKVVEVKNGSIVIEGYLMTADNQELTRVEMAVTPETRLIKRSIFLEVGNDGPYTPKEEVTEGSLSDFKLRTMIDYALADRNLLKYSKVSAREIRYVIMVSPPGINMPR